MGMSLLNPHASALRRANHMTLPPNFLRALVTVLSSAPPGSCSAQAGRPASGRTGAVCFLGVGGWGWGGRGGEVWGEALCAAYHLTSPQKASTNKTKENKTKRKETLEAGHTLSQCLRQASDSPYILRRCHAAGPGRPPESLPYFLLD